MLEKLSRDNYQSGLLIDDLLTAGVTELNDDPGFYAAFIIENESGEYLAYERHNLLDAALNAINSLERSWGFEKATECSGCATGACETGGCHKIST